MSKSESRNRVLIAKPGLDGHDRGAKFIARALRDAGFEVVYTGIRRSPEEIAAAAVQEDVGAIGLSSLSGGHSRLFPAVIEALATIRVTDIPVLGGGVIPDEDIDELVDLAFLKAIDLPRDPTSLLLRTPLFPESCQHANVLNDVIEVNQFHALFGLQSKPFPQRRDTVPNPLGTFRDEQDFGCSPGPRCLSDAGERGAGRCAQRRDRPRQAGWREEQDLRADQHRRQAGGRQDRDDQDL